MPTLALVVCALPHAVERLMVSAGRDLACPAGAMIYSMLMAITRPRRSVRKIGPSYARLMNPRFVLLNAPMLGKM